MSGELKTLKQIEAAQSVIRDAMEILETFYPRQDRKAEARFVWAAMTVTRRRLNEVSSELSDAHYRAHLSPENNTIVSKALLEDVTLFRAMGPAQLSSLLKNRLLHRALQEIDGAKQDCEGNDGSGCRL